MKKTEQKNWIYDWQSLGGVQHIGILTTQRVRGKAIFSFEYNETWFTSSGQALFLDPNLGLLNFQVPKKTWMLVHGSWF